MERVRSYPELISRYETAAGEAGARLEAAGEFSCPMGSYTIYTLRLRFGDGRQRLCLSTGMHGDEPAGPESMLLALGRLAAEKDDLNADILVFPCDNPTGYELGTRENFAGVDLNREFAREDQQPEIAIVERALQGQSFDFTLDIHEDYEMDGFYLYERVRKGRRAMGEEIIAALRAAGQPIHEAEWIEGRPASGGIIWPAGRLRRYALPKAVYLWHQGSPHLITTESPGLLPLEQRVRIQMTCFDVVLQALKEERFAPGAAGGGS